MSSSRNERSLCKWGSFVRKQQTTQAVAERHQWKSEAGVSEGTESFRQHYAPSDAPPQSCGRHPDEASDVGAACHWMRCCYVCWQRNDQHEDKTKIQSAASVHVIMQMTIKPINQIRRNQFREESKVTKSGPLSRSPPREELVNWALPVLDEKKRRFSAFLMECG